MVAAAVLGIALLTVWITMAALAAGKQRAAADAIRARGGFVAYDYMFDAEGHLQVAPESARVASLGQDFLHHVVHVGFSTETGNRRSRPDTSKELLGPLAAFPRLRSIQLHTHQVSDATLEVLGRRKDLEEIYLFEVSQVTDRGVEYLRGLKKLRVLCLTESQITDHSLEVLSGISTITHLNLQWHDFTDGGLAHLAGMKQLTDLAVCGPHRPNRITDAGLLHLKSLPNLKSLMIQYTLVSEAGLQLLIELPQLKGLSLHGSQVTKEGIEMLRQARPDLKM
jgi:hypothetical protein